MPGGCCVLPHAEASLATSSRPRPRVPADCGPRGAGGADEPSSTSTRTRSSPASTRNRTGAPVWS
ncbi:hypothetical protein A6A25_30685 [Saccharothrix sp. CB00851]|nr:hypothetical protein A6A25_30685 [Saccharothrix sp. CB00851]